jgi:hypothetical protein
MDRGTGIWIEACENFQKQTCRNHCLINGPNKVQMLTVPVKKARRRCPIREVKIDYAQPWIRQHLRSLQSAYGKAPFFEHYADDLFQIIQKKIPHLFDLNLELLTKCLDLLRIKKNINLTEAFYNKPKAGLTDLRGVFCDRVVSDSRATTKYHPYYQVFGRDFVENLSIVDLLFCEGPQSHVILSQCALSLNEEEG